MTDNHRLYSFVAGLYLSPLQCGLQTAHVVSELYANYRCYSGEESKAMKVFDSWAQNDKTIIILNALNCKGVKDVREKLKFYASILQLPMTHFCEDEDSLNGAMTAAGIVVPKQYYDVESTCTEAGLGIYRHYIPDEDGIVQESISFREGDGIEFEFIYFLKSFRLV